jgi:hypothetical protein
MWQRKLHLMAVQKARNQRERQEPGAGGKSFLRPYLKKKKFTKKG